MMRKLHAIAGLLSAVFIVVLSVTGIFLNYPRFVPGSLGEMAFEQHPQGLYQLNDDVLVLKSKQRLFYSNDEAKSFQPLSSPFSANDLIALVAIDSTVYAALNSGILYKADISRWTWKRLRSPEMGVCLDMTHDGESLLILSDKGLHRFSDNKWVLVKKNESPLDLHYVMRAIHAGYYPFSYLKAVFSLSALALLYLTISGLFIYVKSYTKLLTKKNL